MLAPAKIPVAAGKNTANTVKKDSGTRLPSEGLNWGPKLSRMVGPAAVVRINRVETRTQYEDWLNKMRLERVSGHRCTYDM